MKHRQTRSLIKAIPIVTFNDLNSAFRKSEPYKMNFQTELIASVPMPSLAASGNVHRARQNVNGAPLQDAAMQ